LEALLVGAILAQANRDEPPHCYRRQDMVLVGKLLN